VPAFDDILGVFGNITLKTSIDGRIMTGHISYENMRSKLKKSFEAKHKEILKNIKETYERSIIHTQHVLTSLRNSGDQKQKRLYKISICKLYVIYTIRLLHALNHITKLSLYSSILILLCSDKFNPSKKPGCSISDILHLSKKAEKYDLHKDTSPVSFQSKNDQLVINTAYIKGGDDIKIEKKYLDALQKLHTYNINKLNFIPIKKFNNMVRSIIKEDNHIEVVDTIYRYVNTEDMNGLLTYLNNNKTDTYNNSSGFVLVDNLDKITETQLDGVIKYYSDIKAKPKKILLRKKISNKRSKSSKRR